MQSNTSPLSFLPFADNYSPTRSRTTLLPFGPRSLSSWVPLGLMPLTLFFPVMQKRRRGGSEASIRCLRAKRSSVQLDSPTHPVKGTLVPLVMAGKVGRVLSLMTMHVWFHVIFGAYTHLSCRIEHRAALARAQSQLSESRAIPSTTCSHFE